MDFFPNAVPWVRKFMEEDDAELKNVLDAVPGSEAVRMVLRELLRKENNHTIPTLLSLLEKGD